MDPSQYHFDIAAYNQNREIEENYIVNRFRERRNKILEDNAPRSRKYLNRDHAAANQRLIDDYFANEPTYDDAMFRHRYRMKKNVFLQIVGDLSSSDNYFTQRVDAANKEADAVDEYIKIGGTTALECLRRFCKGIIRLYEQVYLRAPTQDDLQRILHVSEMRGFPGMIGSIDCMHWEWKNCPKAWEGQFTRGDKGTTTVILEAVASHDLWIWHAFFGCPGTLNDINFLDRCCTPKFALPFPQHFLITRPLKIKIQLGFPLLKTSPCTVDSN
ncbi:unnamed protein product [Vicia faba]|uniref:Uncharacterized protein n=1 Tax=Vicia faba TaxID=3906 RepID=A0AAV1B011_VICFA|nr:unnamed protein product [Vicia faba]